MNFNGSTSLNNLMSYDGPLAKIRERFMFVPILKEIQTSIDIICDEQNYIIYSIYVGDTHSQHGICETFG